jgi:predicted AAA+ superfamily ATPase
MVANLTKKVARHPKVHIADSGLAAHLLGKDPNALSRPTDPARGPLLETFVFNELLRQASFHQNDVTLFHLRERDGAEVDILAERADGGIVAFEVKTSSSVTQGDARWLNWLKNKIVDDFVGGVVLYTGERPYRFGDRLYALPISYLWSTG